MSGAGQMVPNGVIVTGHQGNQTIMGGDRIMLVSIMQVQDIGMMGITNILSTTFVK